MNEIPRARGTLARLATRLAGLWILAGGLFKLLAGTPADLPQIVRDAPLELGLTFKLAITVELGTALVALLKPRWGWVPVVALLLVFEGVVATQIAAGDASCGCFGSTVSIPPWVMLTIDAVLLALVLLARPWKSIAPGGPRLVPITAVLAVAAALPWFLDRQASEGVSVDGVLGEWQELNVKDWQGKLIFDTPLGKPPLSDYIDLSSLPLDGLWVFYRYTCDHCAAHLADLADRATGDTLITLVRLQERHDTEANRVVYRMPDGDFVQHAMLPDRWDYVVTTPAELWLEAGVVTAAREGVTPEESLLP